MIHKNNIQKNIILDIFIYQKAHFQQIRQKAIS